MVSNILDAAIFVDHIRHFMSCRARSTFSEVSIVIDTFKPQILREVQRMAPCYPAYIASIRALWCSIAMLRFTFIVGVSMPFSMVNSSTMVIFLIAS
jgi:hypothetical protein